jgi:hypothetical protein
MMTAKDLLIQSSSSAQTSATMKTMVLVGDVLRPSHQHLSQMMKAAMATKTKTTEVFTKLSNVRGLQLSRFVSPWCVGEAGDRMCKNCYSDETIYIRIGTSEQNSLERPRILSLAFYPFPSNFFF